MHSDEASILQRRARNLLVKMKLEQNLIDAYSCDGWKGQSREKIRPEKELQRANNQILRCKLGIRDVIHQLELLSSSGQIDESLIFPDGSVHHDHIYCAKCKLKEALEDNDIILCDGTCNCAFHQKCLDPPLATEDIPSGDQGWFCKFCDCKLDILETVNAHLGTQFSSFDTWKDIFVEASLSNDGATLINLAEEWPDEDSEDNDYDPLSDEATSIGVNNSCGQCSSSSILSLESEAHSVSGYIEGSIISNENSEIDGNAGLNKDEPGHDETISGRRRRYAVDYRKLYDVSIQEVKLDSLTTQWPKFKTYGQIDKEVCDEDFSFGLFEASWKGLIRMLRLLKHLDQEEIALAAFKHYFYNITFSLLGS